MLPRFHQSVRPRILVGVTAACLPLAGAPTAVAFTPNYGGLAPAQPLLTARAAATATALGDGRILVAGGEGNGAFSSRLASAETYDPATDTWQPAASLGTARAGATATRLADDRVLLAGGVDTTGQSLASGEIYDPAADTWSAVDPAHPLGAGRAQAGSVLLRSGDVLVVGGSVGSSPNGLPNADLYDPVTNQFAAAAPLSVGRAAPAVASLPDGKVLVAGGADSLGNPLDSGEVYDPAMNTWTAVANSLSAPRLAGAAAALPDGRVLIAGGARATNPFTADAGSDIYDESTNRFMPGPAMPTPRALFTLTSVGGHVLAAGGAQVVAGAPVALRSTDVYDDATNTWHAGPDLSSARYQQTAAPTPGGGAAIIGGSDSMAVATSSVDRYVPIQPPAAPLAPSAAAVSGAALITWGTPFNGGSPITSYVITASPGGATMTVTNGATGAIFTGLHNGTSYTFSITATTQVGTSPTATSNPVVPTAVATAAAEPSQTPPPAPQLKLSGLPRAITLSALLRGVRFTVIPNEPQALDAQLVGATTTATLARVRAFDVTIARVHRGLSTGPQQLTLRVPRRLIGQAQRFALRLIVTGTTRAGNRTTASWKLTVAGARRSTRHR